MTVPTGRVLSPLHAAWLCVEKHWAWYRRNWRATVISNFLQPVLFLVAIGIGFGSQVQPSEITGGVPYVQYLAPALVVITAIQNATFESTYAILSAFIWQKTFIGIVATPITPAQVLYGQLIWIVGRLLSGCAVFLVIAALLGAVSGPGVLLALPFATLAGMAFSAPIVAFSATLDKPDSFNTIFRFVLMPMTLFTGAFFPVSQLPDWLEPLVWITPAWHGIELARGATFGTLGFLPALGHVAFLAVLTAVGIVLARKYFHRRLAM
ncbi:transport permease protein [Lentzea sp. NBRC 105346]|uniref:ABC transporter permease n=1 Tax=Lentzea sp. NBRC 105346 TaxID=3032205 RepID=UPI0024A26EA7|nr:ABC transporter permease [Lentzea sp. NBRC 105346]GLZ32691.1 transport permease protein [Lentzea sp. NBRC 105346]